MGHGLGRARDLALFECLDDVAVFEVLVVREPDTALVTRRDFARVVLETTQRRDGAFQIMVPSRRKRTFEPRVMTPSRTKHPAMAPILGTRNTSRTSASPVTTSSKTGDNSPSMAASISSINL